MAEVDIEKLVVQMSVDVRQLQQGMNKALGITNRQARAIEQRFKALNKTATSSFSALGGLVSGPLAALGAALSVREVISFSDAWTRANNSLKVAGLSGTDLTGVMGELFAAAQRQGAPLEALTQLYGRAAQSATELGATRQDLVLFSEDVARALRVAGTSPEQASGALLQLSQLLGSARVQAEEFNSVNEGARPILQAVANGIEEAGGSVSKLKQLVTDGEISNVAFFKGFQAGAAGIREQAATASDTIAQSFTRINNALTKTIGELAETSGASKNAATNLAAVADAIGAIPGVVDKATGKLGELRQALSEAGNSPFWTRVGKIIGVNFTPEEAAANGITYLPKADPRQAGLNMLKAGMGKPLSQDTGNLGTGPAANPIKAADYPVVGAKEKKAGREKINQFDREVEAIQRHTAAMQVDVDTIGKSTFETEKARAAQELLSAAKKQYGDKISPEVAAKIDEESSAYARVAAAAEEAQRAHQEWVGLQQEIGGFLADNIASVAAGYSDFNDVLKNGIGLLAQMALKAALLGEGPLAGFFGGQSTSAGPGGLIGALFKGLSGGFADGGYTGPGGRNQPAGVVHKGEYVFDADSVRSAGGPAALEAMRRGLKGYAGGGYVGSAPSLPRIPSRGGGGGVTFAPTTTIDARGSNMSESQIQRMLDQRDRQILKQVPSVVNASRARTPSYQRT